MNGSEADTKTDTNDVIALTYQHSFDLGALTLDLRASGDSSLSLSFNHDEQPRLGIWKRPLTRAVFDDLVRALHASGWESVSDADGPPRNVVISERRRGEVAPRTRVFERIPAEMWDVWAAIGILIAELEAHPWRVLRGEVRWLPARGSELALSVTLTNAGSAGFVISNPACPSRSAWRGLRLTLIPARVGAAEHPVGVPGEDVQLQGADPTSETLRLGPGESVTLTARARPSLAAGRYETRLEVHAGVERQGALHSETVPGVLWLYPGAVTLAAVN